MAVKLVAVHQETVLVRVLARLDRRTARPANAVGHIAAIKAHPGPGNAINIWRLVQAPATVGADGLVGVVVTENEENIRLFGRAQNRRKH